MPAEGMEPPYFALGAGVVRFYYDSASMATTYQVAHVITKYFAGSVGVVLVNMYVAT